MYQSRLARANRLANNEAYALVKQLEYMYIVRLSDATADHRERFALIVLW